MTKGIQQTCIRALADPKQIIRCKKQMDKVEAELSMLADIAGLMGNGTRLKILYLLHMENTLCVCDLSDILNMTVPAISQQLRRLKDGGIITSQREGTVIYYSLNGRYRNIAEEILDCGLNKELLAT